MHKCIGTLRDCISFPSQGSDFIALDINDDEIINDVQESFGSKTGIYLNENGFTGTIQHVDIVI